MAVSRIRGSTGLKNRRWMGPPRTPGPLGINDAADPSVLACLGDTPGPLGVQDSADPTSLSRHPGDSFWIGDATAVLSPICLPPVGLKPFSTTYAIPRPSSTNPPRISDTDIAKEATTLAVEPAVIYAVSKVESGGTTGFDDQGRPKILFEALWFNRFTEGRYDKSHPHLSQASWTGARRYYSIDQWTRLTEAFALNAEAALKSASWGKFQVMGFNHNGFDDVFTFCDAMFVSEAGHLRSFVAFCTDNKLVQYLRSKDWAKFALGYNGPAYKENKYDEKMESAYNEYKRSKGSSEN